MMVLLLCFWIACVFSRVFIPPLVGYEKGSRIDAPIDSSFPIIMIHYAKTSRQIGACHALSGLQSLVPKKFVLAFGTAPSGSAETMWHGREWGRNRHLTLC